MVKIDWLVRVGSKESMTFSLVPAISTLANIVVGLLVNGESWMVG